MAHSHSRKGRLVLLATPLLTASLALALSACGSGEPAITSAPTTTTLANADAHLQPDPEATATAQPASNPVTVTFKPTAACPGKPITVTATVGGSFQPARPPLKNVGSTWDIRIYDEEGDLLGLPTLLHTNGKTLTFNWSTRVPGVYVMFVDVTGAPGSSGSTMTWFVVLPEYACQGKEPTPTPTPPSSPTPKPTSTPTPTPAPKPTSTTAKP
jgi:hypothetical protein